MIPHLLDTDMASYVIKGKSPQIKQKLQELPPSQVFISVITKAELLYGLKLIPPEHKLQLAVKQFLKIVRTLPWDCDAASFYAEIRYQLVSTGRPIGELDMMIAAHSLAAGAVLVSNNVRHFSRIKLPLNLVTWS